jgi:hypothetical protein
MHKILVTVSALAVAGFAAVSPALALDHAPGGPIQSGKMCWTSTQGDLGFGYWQGCPKAAKPLHMKKKGM